MTEKSEKIKRKGPLRHGMRARQFTSKDEEKDYRRTVRRIAGQNPFETFKKCDAVLYGLSWLMVQRFKRFADTVDENDLEKLSWTGKECRNWITTLLRVQDALERILTKEDMGNDSHRLIKLLESSQDANEG